MCLLPVYLLPQDAALLVQLAEPLVTAAEAQNQLQVERLLRLCQEGAQMQQQAEQAASQLKDTYYELSAQLRDAQPQEVSGQGVGCNGGTKQAAEPLADGPCQPCCCWSDVVATPNDLTELSCLPQLRWLRLLCVQQGLVQQQAPSTRLATVLPAQLSSSSGGSGLACAGLCSVPPELQQQQHQVEQLWESLQQYMQDFEGLQRMVQHLVGSAVHPYAIDAGQLRAFAQAGELPAAAAPPAAGEGSFVGWAGRHTIAPQEG